MYFYEGYSCPVCQQLFTEKDDVVACPHCGLPHHRECWAKEWHCHLHHLHDTPEQWRRDRASTTQNSPQGEPTDRVTANENSAHQICAQCHTSNPEFSEFCKHCGTSLKSDTTWQSDPQPTFNEYQPFHNPDKKSQTVAPNEVIDGIKAEDLAAFVGAKSEYYLPRFRRIARNGSSASWNWAAFFFGPLWLLYRKMYGLGAIVMILELLQTAVTEIAYKNLGLVVTDEMSSTELFSLIESVISKPSSTYFLLSISLLSVIMLVVSIVLALFGNRLYRDHCGRVITHVRQKTPDLTAGELSSIGGVSIAVMVIGYIAQYFITQILIIFI